MSVRGTDATRSAVAHLGRRAGFGLPADEVDRLAAGGYEAAVEHFMTGLRGTDAAAEAVPVPAFDTAGYLASRQSKDPAAKKAANAKARQERRALVRWWVLRMHAADHQLHEKLTFHWHDHFATSLAKVKLPELMFVQYRTLYERGPGAFDALVDAIARDPAMLRWLDGVDSSGRQPNENFARELLELFTLGHGSAGHGSDGHSGHGSMAQPYTEDDVQAAARALTGWRIDRTRIAGVLQPRRHDGGSKTLLGTTGDLGLDDVVRLTTRHPASAPHVVSRLWSRLARPGGPDDPVVVELARTYADDLDTTALLRRIFLHPEFLAPESRTGLVKSPVEWVIGSLRSLGLGVPAQVQGVLAALGQIPFAPPDVSGWPANEAWLSTASARTRLEWARGVATRIDLGAIESEPTASRPAAVARILGVDAWGSATAAALASVATQPANLLTVALVSPEHLLA
jgi:uncharacterized protein (DUF1800 family)